MWVSINVWTGIIGDHLLGPYLLPERLDGKNTSRFCNSAARHVERRSSTHPAGNVVSAGWSARSLRTRSAKLSGRNLSKQMDWARWSYSLATALARSFLSRFLALMRLPLNLQMNLSTSFRPLHGKFAICLVCFSVRQSFLRRCTACIAAAGKCFEHLL